MSWLVSASLRFRALVFAGAVLMVIAGIQSADQIPLDVFPEFAPPIVEIQTEAPGLTTPEVERLVTIPLETALNGIPHVQTVRSKSVQGLSSVRLIFEPGTDLLIARQLVQERLAQGARQLPKVSKPPVILQPLSSLSRTLKIGLSSKKLSQRELTVLSKWTIRPRLTAITGVANVAIWGDRDREFHVLVNPARLRANEVRLDEIVTAVQEASAVGSGGFIDTPNQRIAASHRQAIRSPKDLREAVVAWRTDGPLVLGDVANVDIGSPPPIGNAIINDGPGIMLIVEKQPWANTLKVTREVEKAMEELKPALKDVEIDTTIFRPATFIERALENLTTSLLIGCVLVILVLAFFLYDWRAALISSLAIPLSLLAAALVLYYRGGTINTMVLAGLIIALGEVVDDAIIDVENILRRLKLNREAGSPQSTFSVVLSASLEVRSAVVYATIIVVLTLVPVFFLEGLAGSFFRPLASAYVLAILASLVVALTITPALSLILLPKAARQRKEAPLTRALKAAYAKILPPLLKRPVVVSGGVVGLFVAAGAAVPYMGEQLLPKFKETDFLMHWVEKPGIGIEAMDRISILASKELRAIPGVRNFGAHIGRAEVADEVVGPNFTELWISIDPDVDYDKTLKQVEDTVEGYPGLYRDVQTYLTERIKEVLTGASGSIVIRIYGDNLKVLRDKAEEVRDVIAKVEGVTSLKVEQQKLVPQLIIRPIPSKTRQYGLTPARVIRATATLVNGTRVGEVYEDQKIFGVVVWGDRTVRRDIDALRQLEIDTPSGSLVSLKDVADISFAPAPNAIPHERMSRKIDVTCDVAGRDLGSVAKEIEESVTEKVNFPRGFHPEFLGEYAEAMASRERILWLSLMVVGVIVLLLYSDFQSWRLTAIIFLTLPIALVGGVAGVFISGGILSLGSLIGFVTVLGVAARNGIMLVDHYRHLKNEEGMAHGVALVLRGAQERLAPILMTALTTGLALVPLVVAGNLPGHEIEYPMAFVILGGLTASTLLNLLVIPPLYLRFGNTEDVQPASDSVEG